MPVRKHVPAVAPRCTRSTAGGRAPSKEQKTATQRQQQHRGRSAPDGLSQAQTDPDDIIRKPIGKGARVSKAPGGDCVLALGAAEPPALSIESLSDNISEYETSDSEDGGYSVEEDPIESWYTDVGYLPVLSESTFDVLEQALSPFVTSIIKRKLCRTNGEKTVGLDDRNVRISPCVPIDPFLVVFGTPGFIRESGSGGRVLALHDEVEKYHVDEWRLDVAKAREDGTEATFQRTVVMSMLDRYRLVYDSKDGNQSIIDFAVESTWNCPFMPTRALKTDKPDPQRMLLRPKPDISVAFRLSSIIEDGFMSIIPEATRRIMTYEAQDGTRTQRAFHFLMIEAKNSDSALSDKDGRLQSLNSANAVTITTDDREPPPAGEDSFVGLFFKEVRVFTAVLTGTTITIRMHRACLASPPPFSPQEGRPPFQLPILPDYPVQFEHNELIRLSDNAFARETLVGTFEKIMVDYGIGRLRPLLQQAAKAIADKFYKWEMEKGTQYELGMRHYSHGQTAPPPSARTSRAASQATWLSSVSATSNSRWQGPARQASSRLSADSPAAQFSFTAQAVGDQLEPPKKKTRWH